MAAAEFYPAPSIRSYVRRQGRFTKAQQRAWQQYADKYVIAPRPTGAPAEVDWSQVFGRSAALHVDIGSGYGEALAALAQQHADNDYIAFEVHRPGVGALMNRLAALRLSNVRIVCADAMCCLPTMFAEKSIARAYILFPDPWLKPRQQKRRLLRPDFAAILATRLSAGGEVLFTSDCADYVAHAEAVFCGDGRFQFSQRYPGSPVQTGYAKRAADAGRKMATLVYSRVGRR